MKEEKELGNKEEEEEENENKWIYEKNGKISKMRKTNISEVKKISMTVFLNYACISYYGDRLYLGGMILCCLVTFYSYFIASEPLLTHMLTS